MCSLIIVAGVIIAIVILITIVCGLVLFFFSGFSSTPGRFFFLTLFALLLFNLLLVHRIVVFGPHHLQLLLLLLALSLLLAIKLQSSFDLSATSTDLSISRRLGPLAWSIRLRLTRWDRELDEGAQAAEKPFLDKLGKDNAKFASGRVNLLTELVSEGENDLLELEEHDFDTLKVDDVL